MKAICASVNLDLFMVLPRPTARLAHAAKLEFSSKDRSENREADHQGALQWQGSDTSLKRSLRSCGRSTFWSRRARTWWTQSATAAKIGGMDRQTLRDWVIRFNEQGADGLINIPSAGMPPKLNAIHKARGRCVMRAKLVAAAALSLLLAGAALAGSCSSYCGSFAGYRWCNTTCR